MIVHITKDNYEAEVINSDKPVLLDFGAPWCGPCKKVFKIVQELEKEQDAVKLAKVDIDETPEVASKNGILSIPVLILFKDGKAVGRLQGVKSKDAVLEMIAKNC